MNSLSEKSESIRLLAGIENGTLTPSETFNIASKRDPAMIYFILRYLREKYPANDPKSTGVVGRLIELSSTYKEIVKLSREGEKDVLREWFDDTHNMREFFAEPEQFIELIVEKMDG